MKRLLICCSVALSLVAVGAGAAQAEVKTRNKSQVKFEGMLGRMMGMFAGKAVRKASCRRARSRATAWSR